MSIPLFDVNSQEPLFDQAQRRTLAEAALRSITASTAHARGDDFLRILVRELAEALDVRYVIAGRLVRQDELEAGVVAALIGAPVLVAVARGRRVAGL